MAKADTYEWEKSGFVSGECDIPNCHGNVTHRHFYYPTYMNGDAECLASLCDNHKTYKTYGTTEKIIEAFNKTEVK